MKVRGRSCSLHRGTRAGNPKGTCIQLQGYVASCMHCTCALPAVLLFGEPAATNRIEEHAGYPRVISLNPVAHTPAGREALRVVLALITLVSLPQQLTQCRGTSTAIPLIHISGSPRGRPGLRRCRYRSMHAIAVEIMFKYSLGIGSCLSR